MPTVVGLLSDSHSRWERTKRALQALRAAGATVFVHCGDIEDELVLDQLAGLDSHLVWGNCDWNSRTLERYARDLGIAVHGDAGELPLVTTVLKRPAGFLGLSSQYWAGGFAEEPKNIAA